MYLRLALLIVFSVLLAGTHWKAYVSGKQAMQAHYQQAQLQAEQAARAREQQLVAERQKSEERYVQEKRKAAAAASGAQSELDRLRDALASSGGGPTCPAPAASARVDAGTGLESELLGHCAQTLVGVAAEADRLEAQVVGLQQYIKQVCQKR